MEVRGIEPRSGSAPHAAFTSVYTDHPRCFYLHSIGIKAQWQRQIEIRQDFFTPRVGHRTEPRSGGSGDESTQIQE